MDVVRLVVIVLLVVRLGLQGQEVLRPLRLLAQRPRAEWAHGPSKLNLLLAALMVAAAQ